MFNISKLVNRITERGTGREGSGDSSASFVESEEQHSAEGFLCPPCMRAFPSAEALEEHYNATHLNFDGTNEPSSDSQSSTNGDIQILRQEIQNLQSSLNEEKTTSAELKNEVLKMQAGFQSREDDNVSVRSQERESESAKSLLTSEVALLRQQLTDSLEHLSQIKKEKEILGQKLLDLATENDVMKSEVTSLNSQLAHKNSIDDAAVLKQELVSVQRMMDQLSLEKEKEIEDLRAKVNMELSEQGQKDNDRDQEILLLKQSIQEDQKTIEDLKLGINTDKEQKSKEVDILKDQLSDSDRKREIAEKEGADLKDIVKGLETKLEELYSKIEGGEGAKAALDTLQKENATLKESLESSQDNINEVSKNLYNTNKKLEKSEAEHRKLSEGYSAEKEEWKAKELLWKDQLKRKEDEIKLASQKHNELSKLVQEKDSDIKSKQASIGQIKEAHEKMTKEFNILTSEKEENNKNLEQLKLEMKTLEDAVSKKSKDVQDLQSTNKELLMQIDTKTQELNKILQSLQESQDTNKNIEDKLSSSEKEKVEMLETYSAKVKTLEGELKAKIETLKNKADELEETKRSSETVVTKLKAELELSKNERREKEHQLEGLQETIQDVRSKYDEREGKIQLLQVQTDEILTDKIDLEKRVKSSEDEKSLLLERCLSGESEVEELRQTIKTIQRKLDDSHAALQELGRENQSLQMESAKLQGRKWADDSVVTNCSTCEKEFTLTQRKHHCRHCGQIFCNDCSSRNAAVPSCKKPARVCDACYQELMTK